MHSREARKRINKALGVVMREMPRYRRPGQREYSEAERDVIMRDAGIAFVWAVMRFPMVGQPLLDMVKFDTEREGDQS